MLKATGRRNQKGLCDVREVVVLAEQFVIRS